MPAGPSNGCQALRMTEPSSCTLGMWLLRNSRLGCRKVGFIFVFEPVCKCQDEMIYSFSCLFFPSPCTLAAIVEKKDLGEEYKNHLRKFLPSLRYPLFGLSESADWLEALVDGSLPSEPLLDVSAILACTWKVVFKFPSFSQSLWRLDVNTRS